MENNFDNFFKDKLEHRKFEMKPEYWEGAEALIDADERSDGWRRFFIWFGVALIVGLGVFFIWKNDVSNELVENEKISNTIVENVLPETIDNSISTKKEFENKSSVEEESNIENNLSSNLEEKNNSVKVLAPALGNDNSSKNEEPISKKLEISKVFKSKPSGLNQDGFSETIPDFDTNNIDENEFNSDGTGNDNANTSTKNISNENSPIITFNDSENKSETNESIKDSSSKADEEGSKEEVTMVQPIVSNSTILLPFLEMFLANNKKIKELDLNKTWPYTPPRNKFAFGIFGGAVGYPLTENSSDNLYIGFKTGLILERNFQIGKANMAVGTELTYHSRSGNFVETKQNEVASYSFGRSVAQAKLTPENLRYFEIPLYLKYQKKRMTFETGASFNYLLGVKGTVTEVDGTFQSGWVPSLGFKNKHVNVLLGFHYRISDNLQIGVRANYTPGGILDKNAILPEGITGALQESRPFYLTIRVTQYLKFKK